MKLLRRNFLHLVAGAAVLPAVSRMAQGQTYPSRPVHFIVSFAAGGPNDIIARIVGHYLSDHLGQQVVIENRAGAAGNVGMQSALNSAPDGYTIAFVGPNYAINPGLYEKLPFDFIRDSVPVAGMPRIRPRAHCRTVRRTCASPAITSVVASIRRDVQSRMMALLLRFSAERHGALYKTRHQNMALSDRAPESDFRG
jgi:Tripartite tricarboxylate transporter family receptor